MKYSPNFKPLKYSIMKTIELKLYSFNELSEQAKENAIKNNYDINIFDNWYDFIYDDAKENGLKINSFDIDRGNYCNMEFIYCVDETMNLILSNCGQSTDLYKLANEFKKDFNQLVIKYSNGINLERVMDGKEYDFDNDLVDLENQFINDLENEYLYILKKEYQYLISDEAISEALIANEYDFLENGNRY